MPRLLATVMLTVAAPAVSADPARDAQLAAFCTSCHRLDRHDGAQVPIVGIEPSRFEGLMKAFRADNHPNHIMHAVSLALSDEQIAALAGFLAARNRQGEPP